MYDPAQVSNKYLDIAHDVLLEYFYRVDQGKWVWVIGADDLGIFRLKLCF